MFSANKYAVRVGRVLLLAGLVLVLLALTALAVALPLAWFRGTSFLEGPNPYIGLVCGLIAWLFIAVFHFRRESIEVPFPEQSDFVEQVQAVLEPLGYEQKSTTGDFLSFKPTFASLLLGGGVQVALNKQTAKISGPKVCLELLRQRLRIHNHLDNVHQAIQEGRRRQGERLLKRLHLNCRFSPKQWAAFQRHVLAPLAREGEVLCELSLMVQNDAGVRENTFDLQVRPWLQAQDIPAEVHREPLFEPMQLAATP